VADSASAPKSEWAKPAVALLAAVFVMNLLGRGSGETYTVFLAPLERSFGWSRSQLTSVYSLYLLVGALIAPLVGTLFDRLGPRVVYSLGLAMLAGAYLAASTLTTLAEFYLYVGVIIGLGVALVGMVPASGLLVRWYRHRLATAIGIAFAAAGCGTLVFVPIAQVMLEHADWRTTYRVIGYVLAAAVPIVVFAIPWKQYAAGRAEYRSERSARSADGGWTLRAALRTRTYWGLAAMFTFTSFGMYIVVPQTVVYLIDAGFTPVVAASAFGAASMLSVASVTATGFSADRFGNRRTVTVSFMGSVLGILMLVAISFEAAFALLVLYVVIFGFSQGVRGPIISSICAKKFAGPRVATIYGTLYSTNSIGAAAGALAGGVLHDLTGGYRVGFVCAIAALAIAAAQMWIVRDLREHR
jgi:MFS family permease